MKIEFANTIPLRKILHKIGLKPLRIYEKELIYVSPFSEEKRPTLRVYPTTNTWRDTNLDHSGNTIVFICAYLKSKGHSHTEVDALRWLKNVFHAPPKILLPFAGANDTSPKYEVRGVLPVTHVALLRYLDARKIDRRYIADYLRELRILNSETGKIFRAVGIRNEDNGYTFTNPTLSGTAGICAITFIRDLKPKSDSVHVFTTIFDYLSLLSSRKGVQLDGDAIILNEYRAVNDAIGYLRNYGYRSCFLWLTNCEKGFYVAKSLATALQGEESLAVSRMNSLYLDFHSVNDWWISRIKQIN